jgi:hypothetical protein
VRATAPAAALIAAALLAGCGDDLKPPAPAGTVSRIGGVIDSFQQAAANRDGPKMCSLLSTDLKQRVADQGGGKCDDVIAGRLAQPYSSVTVRSLTIDPGVSRAGAQVVEKDGAAARMFFVQQGDSWLVDAIRRPGIGTPLQ